MLPGCLLAPGPACLEEMELRRSPFPHTSESDEGPTQQLHKQVGSQPEPCSLSRGHSRLPQCCAPLAGICDLGVLPHSGVSRCNARGPGQGKAFRLLCSVLRRAGPLLEFSEA